MRPPLGVPLGLLAFMAVLASTAAAIPLDADLQWRHPATAQGLVAISTGTEPAVAHFTGLTPSNAGAPQDVARAQHVRIIIHHWEHATTISHGSLSFGIGDQSGSHELHNAVVNVAELTDAPQMLTTQAPRSADETSSMKLPGARCHIGGPQADGELSFAGGHATDNSIGEPAWMTHERGPYRLGASCWIPGTTTASPDRAFFYGMKVNVTSDEGTQSVETGTWHRRVPDGTRLWIGPVTQILEIEDLTGDGLAFQQPYHGEVRFFADEIVVAGDLEVGASHGRLAWGDLTQDGELDGFAAGGAFNLEPASPTLVSVQGETFEGPSRAASDSTTQTLLRVEALVPIGAAVAVGLGILAKLLWALVLRAAPDRVLDHPRRVQILDFVRANPGVETATVARNLGLQPVRVRFHAHKLQAAGRLVVHRVGGRTALFAAKEGYRGQETRFALLRRQSLRRLYDTLAAEPGLDQVAIAARLDLTQPQVSRSLTMLTTAGLLEVRIDNRRRRYSPRDATGAKVEPWLEAIPDAST